VDRIECIGKDCWKLMALLISEQTVINTNDVYVYYRNRQKKIRASKALTKD